MNHYFLRDYCKYCDAPIDSLKFDMCHSCAQEVDDINMGKKELSYDKEDKPNPEELSRLLIKRNIDDAKRWLNINISFHEDDGFYLKNDTDNYIVLMSANIKQLSEQFNGWIAGYFRAKQGK